MKIKEALQLTPHLVSYNMKIIFAGKFFWFLLAAAAFYGYFMFQAAWNRDMVNEGTLYGMLTMPSLLLIFYPTVFGIQNDEDNRMLEIIFGIPNYRYKVWGIRLLMIYVIVFLALYAFAWLGSLMLWPVDELRMTAQLMFPVLFLGNMAFMFSTIARSGNGTAVIMIVLAILLLFTLESGSMRHSYWNIYLNPFNVPQDFHPLIWEGILVKNRIFMLVAAIVWLLIGLLNLQRREKFV